MEELIHKNCGGEISVIWVYKEGYCEEVEFECRKCKKRFSYEAGFD